MIRPLRFMLTLVMAVAVVMLTLSFGPLSGVTLARAHAAAGDIVVGAVGDMACDSSDPAFNGGAGTPGNCAEQRTSDQMLGDPAIGSVLGLGDYQYDCGDISDYQVSYNPTWGRLDNRMDPVAGNHEYKTGNDVYGRPCPTTNKTAANFFTHFGASAHPETNGHFSFDLGSWHLIGLNANCANQSTGGCTDTSAQTTWLKADLASTTQPCILAFWHQPLFTGLANNRGWNRTYQPWWNTLQAAGADVVLNGHIHNYQRYPALDANGNQTSAGITEYVVGTGGEKQVAVSSAATVDPITWRKSFGYLRMTLLPTGWTADFVSDSGQVLDSSAGACHL